MPNNIIFNEDREIFLECNPSGQWLFLGDDLGTQITKEIAKFMLTGYKT